MGGQRRVAIHDILDDPEERRELMIRTIIATQAREGVETTREEAERAYEKIRAELRQCAAAPRGMQRNDEQSLRNAMATFQRFHSRKPGEAVYPFDKSSQGVFELPEFVEWPEEIACVGSAARVMYESDKWHKRHDTTQYYHDHDKGVKFIVPEGAAEGEPIELPYGWPDEVMLIGQCIGFVVVPYATGEVTEGIMRGENVLVASPDGWVDAKRPNRIFLAIINLDGGGIEGIIDGPNLRITAHGIEG